MARLKLVLRGERRAREGERNEISCVFRVHNIVEVLDLNSHGKFWDKREILTRFRF